MKIAVIGTGALGSLLAAALSPASEVVLVGRWHQQLDAIASNGLTVSSPDGRRRVIEMATTSNPNSLAGACDLALVAVKSAGSQHAADDAITVLNDQGLGITFQNGLGNLPVLQTVLGEHRTAAAVTSQGATVVAPGHIRHAGYGPTLIGCPPELGRTQRGLAAELCRQFRGAGWVCDTVDEVEGLIWAKLAISAAINPLTAILGVRNGALLDDPISLAIMRAAAGEVAALAQAAGMDLTSEQAIVGAMQVAGRTADNQSSMLQDMRRGVPTEIDAICGAIVLRARELGLEAPVNQQLAQLVHKREQGGPTLDATELQREFDGLFDISGAVVTGDGR